MNNTYNRISAAFVVKGYIFFFICTLFVSCATSNLIIRYNFCCSCCGCTALTCSYTFYCNKYSKSEFPYFYDCFHLLIFLYGF